MQEHLAEISFNRKPEQKHFDDLLIHKKARLPLTFNKEPGFFVICQVVNLIHPG